MWRCSVGRVCVNRSLFQSWSTHRNIFPLKILSFSRSSKINLKIIVILFFSFNHSVRCSFFNIMPRLEPVGSIFRPSDSGYGDGDGPQFIFCVDSQQPKIHEVCISGEYSVTPEVHTTAFLDVVAFVGDYFSTFYITPTWSRVPMFGRKLSNGSVEWIVFPSFLWID